MIESDTKGIDALSGQTGDIFLEPLIFDAMIAELGPIPDPPHIDPFDDTPWRALPTIEDLQHLWQESSPLDQLLHGIIGGIETDDLPRFLAAQQALADMELQLKKGRLDAETSKPVGRRRRKDGADGGVVAGGGGRSVQGGSEDGDPVVEGGQAAVVPDAGRPSKVPGARRARNAA